MATSALAISISDDDSLAGSDDEVFVPPRAPVPHASPPRPIKRESSTVRASPVASSSKPSPLRPGRLCDSIESMHELVETTFGALTPPRRVVLNRTDADAGILSWTCGSRSRVCPGVELVRATFDWNDSAWSGVVRYDPS